jgi:hypothetical protein
VRYSSFSAALVASGLRRLGSLRNAGTGVALGESKVSSGTNDVEGVFGGSVAGAGGDEAGAPVGDVDDEALRPVRLSHLGVHVSIATADSAVTYIDMTATGPIDPVGTDADYKAVSSREVLER